MSDDLDPAALSLKEVMEALAAGEADIKAGRVVPAEVVHREIREALQAWEDAQTLTDKARHG